MLNKALCGIALALAMIGTVSAQTVLRFAEGTPNRGTRAAGVEYFMNEAKKLSGGELSFEMHWGGALFDYQSIADGVSNGSADLGTTLAGYTPSKLRALTIGDVPSKFSDPWVGMRAMYELQTTNESLQALLARENLIYLTGYSSTGVQFECRGKADIRTVADIKGKRMRALGIYAKVLRDFGASMVNVTAGDFYQALDTGLIDCSAGYLYTIRSLKTYEVINHLTLVNWGQITGFATLINRETWMRLSEKQQNALREAGSDAIDHFAKLQIDEMDQVIDGLKTGSIGKKVPVYVMPDEEREKLLEDGKKYADDWVVSITKDGVDGKKIWSDYQTLLVKYQTELDTRGYPWNR